MSDATRAAIEAEIADLDSFATLATSITHNAKGQALLKALTVAFKKAKEFGAAEKAIIFTESRKTQAYADYDGRISILKPYLGQGGWLRLTSFSVEALDQSEDHLLFAAVTDEGQVLHEEAAARLFSLKARLAPAPATNAPAELETLTQKQRSEKQREITERNAKFFAAEVEKLDGWAEDLKLTLEREIKDMDRQIKEARRAATLALTLEEKLAGQKRIKTLESQRNEKRRSFFEAQDKVDQRREELLGIIEGKLPKRAARPISLSFVGLCAEPLSLRIAPLCRRPILIPRTTPTGS